MDKENIITEVPETRSPGDGLPLEAEKLSEDIAVNTESEKEEDGPWNEFNVGKGHLIALKSEFMSDFTVTVGEEKFRCHAYILGMASPKLAKIIKTNPHELQLSDVTPSHFRILLEVMYSGEESELGTDVVKTLHVRREAQQLQVYKAVAYCTRLLMKNLNAHNVCSVLDEVQLLNVTEMKACFKIIQEQTDMVLKSKTFMKCEVVTMQHILKQNFVSNITELDLFLAFTFWAMTRALPRQTLGSLLRLIRFHTIKPKENVLHLTTLLTNIEAQHLPHCYKGKNIAEYPAGYNIKIRNRHTTWKVEELLGRFRASTEEISLGWSDGKCVTKEELNASPPLRISVNEDAFLIGVKPRSEHVFERHGDKYMEDVEVTLKDDKGTLISTATFRGEVQSNTYYDVKFPHAVELCADVTYELNFSHNVPGVQHRTWKHNKQVYKSKTSLTINVLDERYSPINYLIIAPKSV